MVVVSRAEPARPASLSVNEVRELTAMARRIAALVALHSELDANYQMVIANTYAWSTLQ